MGMDGAEIVMDAEEHFGVSIPETTTIYRTCGDFHRELVSALTAAEKLCDSNQPATGKWTTDQSWAELRPIIASVLRIPVERVTKEANFVKDLGMD